MWSVDFHDFSVTGREFYIFTEFIGLAEHVIGLKVYNQMKKYNLQQCFILHHASAFIK
jgi:hypothetical protein